MCRSQGRGFFDHGGRIGFEAVISAVEGTAYFDVTEENGRIGIAARGT